MAQAPVQINSQTELDQFLNTNSKIAMVLFMEDWSENSTATGDALLEMISDAEMPSGIGFGKISAESNPEICQSLGISGVPTTLLFHKSKEVFRLSGTRVRELAEKLMQYGMNPDAIPAVVESAPSAPVMDINVRIKRLLDQDDVMLFMKGTPKEPQCGFSRTIVGILNETGVPYSTFNILADNAVREGLKTYSNWKTYPQLYVKGELIGGLDIVKEMKDSGDLIEALNA